MFSLRHHFPYLARHSLAKELVESDLTQRWYCHCFHQCQILAPSAPTPCFFFYYNCTLHHQDWNILHHCQQNSSVLLLSVNKYMQTNGFIFKLFIYLLILEVGCRLKVFLCHQIMCTSHPWFYHICCCPTGLLCSDSMTCVMFKAAFTCSSDSPTFKLVSSWCVSNVDAKRKLFSLRVFNRKKTQLLTWLSELLFVATSYDLRWQPRKISQLEIGFYDHSDGKWTHPQGTASDLTFRPSWRQWLSMCLHLVWTLS